MDYDVSSDQGRVVIVYNVEDRIRITSEWIKRFYLEFKYITVKNDELCKEELLKSSISYLMSDLEDELEHYRDQR